MEHPAGESGQFRTGAPGILGNEMTDLGDFETVNQVYQKMFVGQTLPARAAVQVSALPKGVDIEAEAIAVKKGVSPDEMFADDDFR